MSKTPNAMREEGAEYEGYPGIAHDFEACKQELREAMRYIGEVPHHVFKDPKAVVAFYERNYHLVSRAALSPTEDRT